jgi:hypothetical protein
MRKAAVSLMLSMVLVGCADSDDLDGAWFFAQQVDGRTLHYGEQLIVQEGDRVTITDCGGYSLELRRKGQDLFWPDGSYYYLHVRDGRTLAGPGDNGSESTLSKLFDRTRFASGRLAIASTTVGDLAVDDDVCAQVRIHRYGDDVFLPVVILSAPYADGRIRVEIPFREFSAGLHPVIGNVDGTGPGCLPVIESSAFQGRIGTDVLLATAGSIEIADVRLSSFRLAGTLEMATGEVLVIDAQVDLSFSLPPDAA